MKVTRLAIPEVVLIEPKVFGDERGFFLENFNVKRYAELADIKLNFVQDNHSRSAKNVLRGLHFQRNFPQGKLVQVSHGAVFDVAVDIRPGSASFGKWVAVTLTAEAHNQLYVPPGFAHGFCVLTESADFHYKCTEYYHPEDEGCIIWNDPDIGIEWPISQPVLSSKDAQAAKLCDLA